MKVLNLTGEKLVVRDTNGDLQEIPTCLSSMKRPRIKWERRVDCGVRLEGIGKFGLLEETRTIVDMVATEPNTLYITSRLIKESFHAKNIAWARRLKGKDGEFNGECILIVSSKIDGTYGAVSAEGTCHEK